MGTPMKDDSTVMGPPAVPLLPAKTNPRPVDPWQDNHEFDQDINTDENDWDSDRMQSDCEPSEPDPHYYDHISPGSDNVFLPLVKTPVVESPRNIQVPDHHTSEDADAGTANYPYPLPPFSAPIGFMWRFAPASPTSSSDSWDNRQPTFNKQACRLFPNLFRYDPCLKDFIESLNPLLGQPSPCVFLDQDNQGSLRFLRAGYHLLDIKGKRPLRTHSLDLVSDPPQWSAPQRSNSCDLANTGTTASKHLDFTPLNQSLTRLAGQLSSMNNLASPGHRSLTYSEALQFLHTHPHVSTDMFRGVCHTDFDDLAPLDEDLDDEDLPPLVVSPDIAQHDTSPPSTASSSRTI